MSDREKAGTRFAVTLSQFFSSESDTSAQDVRKALEALIVAYTRPEWLCPDCGQDTRFQPFHGDWCPKRVAPAVDALGLRKPAPKTSVDGDDKYLVHLRERAEKAERAAARLYKLERELHAVKDERDIAVREVVELRRQIEALALAPAGIVHLTEVAKERAACEKAERLALSRLDEISQERQARERAERERDALRHAANSLLSYDPENSGVLHAVAKLRAVLLGLDEQ